MMTTIVSAVISFAGSEVWVQIGEKDATTGWTGMYTYIYIFPCKRGPFYFLVGAGRSPTIGTIGDTGAATPQVASIRR